MTKQKTNKKFKPIPLKRSLVKLETKVLVFNCDSRILKVLNRLNPDHISFPEEDDLIYQWAVDNKKKYEIFYKRDVLHKSNVGLVFRNQRIANCSDDFDLSIIQVHDAFSHDLSQRLAKLVEKERLILVS